MKSVKTSYSGTLPVPADTAWDYLVHFRECGKIPDQEQMEGLAILIEDGRYAGFQFLAEAEGVSPVQMFAEEIRPYESIRHVGHAHPETISKSARRFFPFSSMQATMTFEPTDAGCRVHVAMEFVPRGWIGWLSCLVAVAPATKRLGIREHEKLRRYLASKQER